MASRMALRRLGYFSRACTGYRCISQKIPRLPRTTRHPWLAANEIENKPRCTGKAENEVCYPSTAKADETYVSEKKCNNLLKTDSNLNLTKIDNSQDKHLAKQGSNQSSNPILGFESTLKKNPDYKSIALLFKLNAKYPSLRMDACNDLTSLIKIFKAAKFINKDIKFAESDLLILKKSPEYNKIKNLSTKEYRKYLFQKKELSQLVENFTEHGV